MKLFSIFIQTTFFWISVRSNIYISPTTGCSSSCLGDSSQPYSNLWIAFLENILSSQAEFILLHSNTDMHYLNFNESGINSNQTLEMHGNFTIRPLFCDDYDALNDPNLDSKCINRTDNIKIFLKSDSHTIFVRGNLTLQNVIVDGSENIAKINSDPSNLNLQTCLTSKVRCCESISTFYSTLYPDVRCISSDNFLPYESGNSYAFINLQPIQANYFANLNLIDSSVYEMTFLSSKGFVKIGSSSILNVNNFNITNCLFQDGVFSPSSTSSDWSGTKLTFYKLVLSHYNHRNLSISNTQAALLSFPTSGTFGSILIDSSTFENLNLRENVLVISSATIGINLTIQNSIFRNIYQISTSGSTTFMNCGPASVLTINNTFFSNIILHSNSIFISQELSSKLTISQSNFSSSYIGTSSSSTMISLGDQSDLNLIQTNFLSSTIRQGNFILIGQTSTSEFSSVLLLGVSCLDINNLEKYFFRARQNSLLNIEKSLFKENLVSARSSIIRLDSKSNFTCDQCEFYDNRLITTSTSAGSNGYFISLFDYGRAQFLNSKFANLTCSAGLTLSMIYQGPYSYLYFFDVIFANTSIPSNIYLIHTGNFGFTNLTKLYVYNIDQQETSSVSAFFVAFEQSQSYFYNLSVDSCSQRSGYRFFQTYQFFIYGFVVKNSAWILNTSTVSYFLYAATAQVFQAVEDLDVFNNTISGSGTATFYFFYMRTNLNGTYLKNIRVFDNVFTYKGLYFFFFQQFYTAYISNMWVKNNVFEAYLIDSQSAQFVWSDSLIENNYFKQSLVYSSNGDNVIRSIVAKNNTFIKVPLITLEVGDVDFFMNCTFIQGTVNETSIIYGEVGTKLTFIDTIFYDVVMANSPGLVYGNSMTLKVTNIVFENIIYDETSSVFSMIASSTLVASDVYIRNILQRDSGTGAEPSYLIQFESSTASFYNFYANNISQLLLGVSSTLSFTNMTVKNLGAYIDAKIFILTFQSTLKIENFEYDNKEAEANSDIQEQYFTCYQSDITLKNVTLANFYVFEGQIFELHSSSISIISSTFTNISFASETKKLFLALDGSYFKLQSCIIDISSRLIEAYKLDIAIVSTSIILPGTVQKAIEVSGSSQFEFIDSSLKFDDQSSTNYAIFGIGLTEISSKISINNSFFENARTSQGLFSIGIKNFQTSVYISNSTFKNNFAKGPGAGAISIFNTGSVSYKFLNSKFINNQAVSSLGTGGRGGAIYLSSLNDSSVKTSYLFSGCSFQSNNAELFGGAIYVYNTPPEFSSSNIFLNNTMKSTHPNDIGSHAITLGIYDSNNSRRLALSEYIPNMNAESNLQYTEVVSGMASLKQDLALLDLYGQVVADDYSSLLSFSESRGLKISTQLIRSTAGIFSLSNTILDFIPGDSRSISISTNGIKYFSNLNITHLSSQKNLSLNFRNCQQGELLLSDKTCFPCPFGSTHFILEPNYIGSCITCPNEMICKGGSEVEASKGYYRLNFTADLFIKCPNSDACLGGSGDDQCAYGFRGNLCSQCIEGWGKTREGGGCYDCLKTSSVYFLILVVVIVIGLAIGYSIRSVLKHKKSTEDEDQGNKKSALMKLLINFAQLVSLVSVIPIEWPGALRDQLAAQKTISSTSSDVFSLDCFFGNLSQNSSTSKVYVKVLLYNLLPWLACGIGWLFWVVYFKIKTIKIRKNQEFKNRIGITIFMILFYFQPAVINENLGLLSCLNLYREDKPEYYLQKDYDLQCWKGSHVRWTLGLAIPSLLGWMVYMPMKVFLVLKKRNQSKLVKSHHDQFDFISNGYKEKFYFWEGVTMAKKYLVILAINFSSYHSISMQIFMAMYIFWMCYLIQEKYKPGSSEVYNMMEELSLVCCMVVSSSGIYFYMEDGDSLLKVILVMLSLCANIYFVGKWIIVYFELSRHKSKMLFLKLKNKLKCKDKKKANLLN